MKTHLIFKREVLLYDIGNLAYVESHLQEENAPHAHHTTADIAEAGNVDRVTRIMDLVVSKAKDLLYPYTKAPCASGETEENDLEEPSAYIIELALPAGFSQTSVTLLEKLIHEWIVSRVLYDWLRMTKPESAEKYQERAREAEAEVNSVKHRRMKVFTRGLSPF